MSCPEDTPTTTLDHLDGISVPGDVYAEPSNEYWALLSLREGMMFLARQIAACEKALRTRFNPNGDLRTFGGGNLPGFAGLPMGLLTCSFHWYAISACQYARTVGVIGKLDPLRYVEKVLPEVKPFRDKVAAHYSWATRNEHDNDAERLLSIIPNLTWSDDRLLAGSYRVCVRKGGNASNSESVSPWSVTDVHQGLCARYWPDCIASTNAGSQDGEIAQPGVQAER